ncbi:MAG: SDR family NAD(P)-dependent oxidoreductase [Planctomycetia bacterium]|nr:SDR family NAD(P)-dependent oxidoreductase [Planctomycetia bacterium]
MSEKRKPLAVVTGASSGLGMCFARQLAAEGYDLLLVARRGFVLESLKEELERLYPIAVETFEADLSEKEPLRELEKKIESSENLLYLINNAGFGTGESSFPNVDVEQETRMLALHNLAPMRLCRAALIPMAVNNMGYIINVASAAAFLASRGAADYSATKAFLVSFSRGLQCDCIDKGVHVQALCPGFVRTGFHQSETMKNSGTGEKVPHWLWLEAPWVAQKSLRQARKKYLRRVAYVPSLRYKIIVAFLASRWLSPLRVLLSCGRAR